MRCRGSAYVLDSVCVRSTHVELVIFIHTMHTTQLTPIRHQHRASALQLYLQLYSCTTLVQLYTRTHGTSCADTLQGKGYDVCGYTAGASVRLTMGDVYVCGLGFVTFSSCPHEPHLRVTAVCPHRARRCAPCSHTSGINAPTHNHIRVTVRGQRPLAPDHALGVLAREPRARWGERVV